MNIGQLIAALLPIVIQVTPGLIKDVEDLIRGNPQQPGEQDADYIARLTTLRDANLAKAAEEDKAIEGDGA